MREARDKQTEMTIKFAALHKEIEQLKDEAGANVLGGNALKTNLIRLGTAAVPLRNTHHELPENNNETLTPSSGRSPRKAKTSAAGLPPTQAFMAPEMGKANS